MKKLTLKTLAMTFMFVCAAVLLSCSCSRDKKDLLSCVPADTAGVAVIDLTSLWDQLEVKVDGDDVSYCSEIKEILKLANVKSGDMRDLEKVLTLLDGTSKSLVVFEHDKNIWATFYVSDGGDFIKVLEEEMDADFDKEDGYKVWEQIAVKGDQVWFCLDTEKASSGIDTDELEKLRDLDNDKRFAEKYDKIAEYMLAEDMCSAYCVNVEKVADMLPAYDRQKVNMALSMAFDDARFVVTRSKLDANGSEAELRVLDSKQTPAKFLLPMAKIDASGFAKLDNDSPLVAALAINPELVQKIKGLMEKFYGVLSTGDREALDMFGTLAGTSALSLATASDGVLMINFDNSSTPVKLGTLLRDNGCPFAISTAGNSLIARLPGTPAEGKGKAPAKLVGQYAGVYVDFAKEGGRLINGYDVSKFGKMWVTLGPDGPGVKLTSVWEVKNPLRTLLKEAMVIAQGVMTGSITAPGIEEFGKFAYPAPACEPADSIAYDVYDIECDSTAAVDMYAEDYDW